jgi:hypothetical protein
MWPADNSRPKPVLGSKLRKGSLSLAQVIPSPNLAGQLVLGGRVPVYSVPSYGTRTCAQITPAINLYLKWRLTQVCSLGLKSKTARVFRAASPNPPWQGSDLRGSRVDQGPGAAVVGTS